MMNLDGSKIKKDLKKLGEFSKFLSGPREVFLIALDGDRVIGCSGLKELTKNKGLLKKFYVAKEYRGKGIAKTILDKTIEFAKKKEYKYLVLDRRRNNLRAHSFYASQGFKLFTPSSRKDWPETFDSKFYQFQRLKL